MTDSNKEIMEKLDCEIQGLLTKLPFDGLFNVYQNCTTVEQKLNMLIYCVGLLKKMQLTTFDEIENEVNEAISDGRIAALINQSIFETLWDAVNKNQSDISTIIADYISKNSTAYVGMAQLKQDVKEALTGGSTAVVGTNAVGNSNIQDNAIMGTKLNPSARTAFLNSVNNYAKLNTTTKTLVIKVSGMINGVSFNADEQTLTVPEGNSIIYIDDENIITLASSSGGTKTPIGIVSQNIVSMFYGCPMYVNGNRIDVPLDYYVCAGLNGAEQYMVFDFANKKIIMPPLFYVFVDGMNISISNQEDIDISSGSGLFYDPLANKLVVDKQPNYRIRIAYFTLATNFVQCNYPHKIIPNYANYGAVTDEIPMFGDSIVAGQGGGTAFIPLISARSKIRVLNYGVGSSGYITNPTGVHLMGDGSVNKGTNQTVPDDATIGGMIKANIGNINSRYVAMFGGTNDYAQDINDVVNAMIAACGTVFNAGKIPIVISPIPRQNVNLKALIDAMEAACISANIPFINMWNIGFHPTNGNNVKKYYSDGLHPSKDGNELLATVLSHELKKFSLVDLMVTGK